jgi:Spy/CpxP family protein refolding chaperone
LSDEQKRAIQSIMSKGKLEGALIAVEGARAAKRFDLNLLSESPDPAREEAETKTLLDSLANVARLRLRILKDVVALLTPEQRRVLRNEMSKADTPPELLDVLARVFKLPKD